MSRINRFSNNSRQLHLEHLDKLITEFIKYYPESKRTLLPENLSIYEATLIKT
jgi:hypothetical protein